jgi:RecJ-like exonuclease
LVESEGKVDCPVCHGTGRMTIVEFVGVNKKNVKKPCTACDGRGWIPFIDKTEIVTEATARMEMLVDIGEMGDGWRRSKDWVKVHYFVEGKSLCGNIRSQRAIMRSKGVEEVPPEDRCILCSRKLAELNKKE